jgi:hypothetical protein
VVHGPTQPTYPGTERLIKQHKYARLFEPQGKVYFYPQPTILASIETSEDEEHFKSTAALLEEGLAFHEIDNGKLREDILKAYKKYKSKGLVNLLSSSEKKLREDAVKTHTAKHRHLVDSLLRELLRDLVPGMKLTKLYPMVRHAYLIWGH